MNYGDAIEALHHGACIKRPNWDFYLMCEPNSQNIVDISDDCSCGGRNALLSSDDISATDWEVVGGLPDNYSPPSERKTDSERIAELEAQLKQVMEALNAKS